MRYLVALVVRAARVRGSSGMGRGGGTRLVPPVALPARVRAGHRRLRSRAPPRPDPRRGRHLRREPVRSQRAVECGRGRSHAAATGDGGVHRAVDRRNRLRRGRSARSRHKRALRHLAPRLPPHTVRRRRGERARRVPRRADERRRVATQREWDRVPGDASVRRRGPRASGACTSRRTGASWADSVAQELGAHEIGARQVLARSVAS